MPFGRSNDSRARKSPTIPRGVSVSSELASRLSEVAPNCDTDNLSPGSSKHSFEPPDVLHYLTMLVVRSQDLTADLPSIVSEIRELLDLDSISLTLRASDMIIHAARETDPSLAVNDLDGGSRQRKSAPGPLMAEERQTIPFEPPESNESPTRIPIYARDEYSGFMLVNAKAHQSIDSNRIALLSKVGDTLAEKIEHEQHARPRDSGASRELNVRQLLTIISHISTLSGIDATVQPLLKDIAELLAADRVSLVAPDPVRPRLFTSSVASGVHSDDDLLQLIAVPTVRLALNSGQSHAGIWVDSSRNVRIQSTLLAIPIISHSESVGVIVIERRSKRRFSVEERETTTILGRHLSHALEREHRIRVSSRQNLLLSLVERVTAFIARSTDADDLLALMTREIRRTFGYDCSIAMISGSRLVFGGIDLGDAEHVPEWIRDGLSLEEGIMGRVASTGKPVFIRDVRNDSAFIDTGRNTVSEIALPIRTGDTVTGVLNVESDADNPLTSLDYEILHILASHIGIALSNRQLLTAERETRMAMEAIQRVSTIVAETLDPDESLRRIAGTLGESLGYPIVSLALVEGRALVLRANYGYEPDGFPRVMSVGDGIAGRVARTGQPVLLEDVGTDPDYIRERQEMTSEVCVPIRCNGEIVGILNVEGTRERPVTERDLRLLTTFAEHAGVLLNNARAYAALTQEATLDPMTGVPNLRYFQQALLEQFELSRREDRPLSLAVIDLDDLKEINDSYGHLVGDQVLRELARRMLGQLGDADLLARYAGDEFVALLPGANETQALSVCERLLNAARHVPFDCDGDERINLSLSIGVATYPCDTESSTDLLRAADMAMYVAKESGKNRASNARQAERIRQRSQS
jgi:diguanylate cyclase (GGDEF)-like protein